MVTYWPMSKEHDIFCQSRSICQEFCLSFFIHHAVTFASDTSLQFSMLTFFLVDKMQKIAMLLKVLTKISPGSNLKLIVVLMTNEW